MDTQDATQTPATDSPAPALAPLLTTPEAAPEAPAVAPAKSLEELAKDVTAAHDAAVQAIKDYAAANRAAELAHARVVACSNQLTTAINALKGMADSENV